MSTKKDLQTSISLDKEILKRFVGRSQVHPREMIWLVQEPDNYPCVTCMNTYMDSYADQDSWDPCEECSTAWVTQAICLDKQDAQDYMKRNKRSLPKGTEIQAMLVNGVLEQLLASIRVEANKRKK